MDLMALLNRNEALVHVVDAVNDHTAAWINVVDAVGAARDIGVTWREIGEVLGLGKTGAYYRYARYLKPQERTP